MRSWPVGFGVAVLVLVAVTAMASPAQSRALTIIVNGEPQHFDTPPLVADGLVLVPLRGVFQKLGASVIWVGDTGVIRVQGGPLVRLKLGSREAFVGERLVKLEVEPRYYGHRVYVPLRFVTESLGARVAWSPELRKIEITAALPITEGFRQEPSASNSRTPPDPPTVEAAPSSGDLSGTEEGNSPSSSDSLDADPYEWRA